MENETCLICLEEVEATQKFKAFFCLCNYHVHVECFNKHFNENKNCPVCKEKDFKSIIRCVSDDLSKCYKTYKKILNLNCACKLKGMYLSKYIIILQIPYKHQYFLHSIYLEKDVDKEDLKKIQLILQNDTNKRIIKNNKIKKNILESINYIFEMENVTHIMIL